MDKKGDIVSLNNVWKTYNVGSGALHVLQDVNISIKPHEFVAISGPSGSGKSTMMSLVGCLDIPSKGRVFLDGRDISKLSESGLAQIRGKKIGFIFQQFNLISTLTALKNVELPMMFQSVNSSARFKRAKFLLEKLGLGPRLNHKPSELSGGEQQRVAIARSLANDPDILLADEPTGNLDSERGKEVMEILSELHKKDKKTVVMITHEKSFVKYAQRAIWLKDGRIDRVTS